jgi:hypothetical protein
MVERAKNGTPLTEDEVQGVVNSIQNISPIENVLSTSRNEEGVEGWAYRTRTGP